MFLQRDGIRKKIVRGTLSSKSWCYHAGKFYHLAAAEARKFKAAV